MNMGIPPSLADSIDPKQTRIDLLKKVIIGMVDTPFD
jgi:hypothetical protein